MSSPRSQLNAARLVSAAALVLILGIIVLSTLLLIDDYRERSDQRALVASTSESSLQTGLEQLEGDLTRAIDTADAAGLDLAARIEASEADPGRALTAAVIAAQVDRTLPSLERVIFQDTVGQVVGVDRFGSTTNNPESSGFDNRRAIARAEKAPFVDDQGRNFVSDGIAAYYPVGEEASDGWVVLILRGGSLAVDSTFDRLVGSGSESAVISDGAEAQLQAVVPFSGSQFVASRVVPLAGGVPVSWAPFLWRLGGALAAVLGALSLGYFVRRSHQAAGQRLETAEASAYRSKTDYENNVVGMVELDEMGMIIGVNQAYCDQVRRDRADLVGTSLLALTEAADRTRHLAALDKVITGTAPTMQVDHRIANDGDSSEIWVQEHISRTETPEGPRILVQSQDITFRRFATWELAKQALQDELTGLANRAMLMHRLRTALGAGAASANGKQPLVGLMFIDIDRFKMVNDSLGHEVGDKLLLDVGRRMESAVRPKDTVARFGGDEFVVLCDSLEGVAEAMAIAGRIQRALSAPYTEDGATIHTTLSVGIAVCNAGDMSADELLRNADAAMYQAKERGRNRIEVFDERIREMLVEQMALESELREAIDKEQLTMYFQPIVRSDNYATAGFEALVRWPHPTRGLLTPGQFLAVAEAAGLDGSLDNVVLKKTCQQMARWASRFALANELYVSANKVPKNFSKFVQQIHEVVASTGLPPQLLVVEVVENALIDDADAASQAIEDLKAMGIRVAIDDFGTGYSSLSYLTQFRPTTLKIDRAFVSLLPDDMATASVVQAITEMALALDINVIAEGVETWEQAEVLHRMGVPYFQGYLFAKPRSAEEIESWFEENEGADSNHVPIDFEVSHVDLRPTGLASGGFVRKS